jgi:aspartate 4-decarboxylase
VKAFFIVNPSNPASFAIHPGTQKRLVELVRTKRPDLIVLTDDVYGTFSEGFRSLAADLPRNTILVYSYSKHFGCTGWRLGVVGVHQDNIYDEKLAALPEADRRALRERYGSLSEEPDRLRFIDRLVADSRSVALNHTAGLSLPRRRWHCSRCSRCWTRATYRAAARSSAGRWNAGPGHGHGAADEPLRIGYYVRWITEAWGRGVRPEFADRRLPTPRYRARARESGSVLLVAQFDGPPSRCGSRSRTSTCGVRGGIGRPEDDDAACPVRMASSRSSSDERALRFLRPSRSSSSSASWRLGCGWASVRSRASLGSVVCILLTGCR